MVLGHEELTSPIREAVSQQFREMVWHQPDMLGFNATADRHAGIQPDIVHVVIHANVTDPPPTD